MQKEYKTHDGWRRACKALLTRTIVELGFTGTIYDGLTGETKKDLRDFCICAIPIDLTADYYLMQTRGFRSIGEWDGEKGEIHDDAAETIAETVKIAKSLDNTLMIGDSSQAIFGFNKSIEGPPGTGKSMVVPKTALSIGTQAMMGNAKAEAHQARAGRLWWCRTWTKEEGWSEKKLDDFLPLVRQAMSNPHLNLDMRMVDANNFSIGYAVDNQWAETGQIWKA